MLKRIRDFLGRRARNGTTAAAVRTEPTPSNPTSGDAAPAPDAAPVVHHGPRAERMPIPEDDLDPEAVKIVRRLARFDHIAYLVGGCVRDLLLDRRPKDFDIATSATPRQVKRAFRNCRIVGRRFRLAHVFFQDGKIIEVATFRAREGGDDEDGVRDDGDLMIRDDNVFGTPEEDALRRDFTINQLFYDLGSGTVLDHAGGLEDLKRGIVRTIGDPEIRFREDPIRILRAIKFAARLGFAIEPATRRAIDRTRGEIPRAAPPRILEELNRFCRGGAAVASFRWMRETGVLETVLPEYADAFGSDGLAWDLLRGFLERFDRRVADGEEPATGEIFAALVLPGLLEPLGWDDGHGRVERSRGLDVRKLTDDALRPAALRLRVARKDQEHARQLILALSRMVPAHRVRPATRKAILARPSFSTALDMLGVLAERFGGEFAESLAAWKTGEPALPAHAARAPSGAPDAAEAPDGDRPRRRRRRRRGRGTVRDSAAEPAPAAAARPSARRESPSGAARTARKPNPNLPPVWDERYFFAALPTVPEELDDAAPAGAVGTPEAIATADETATVTDPESTTAPPRRRRRRGGRGRRRKAPGSGEAPPPTERPDDSDD